MPLRLSNLRLSIDETERALPERIAEALRLPVHDLTRWRILRKSFDARDKSDLAFVYSVEVAIGEEEANLLERIKASRPQVSIDSYEEPPFEMPPPGREPLEHRPVIVGSGPAGLAAGYFLAQQGYRPLILERGRAVRERIHDIRAFDTGGPHDPESNYLFGEGGAGTFSDGKLTCRSSGPDVRRILELFAECKGKPSILYDYRPHLGSNRLPAVVKAMRHRIEAMGGEFRFSCRLEDIDWSEGRCRGLATSSGHIPAAVVMLGIGHSARDTYEMLFRRGIPMAPKAFQIGVRIEQPQQQVNRVKYGVTPLEEKIGAADYSLIAHGGRRGLDLFTFCMCAGGYVIPSISEAGYFCTNGMSLSKHDSPFANSGLVVTLGPEHFDSSHVLAGMILQRQYERRAYETGRQEYLCPIQSASDFLARRQTKVKPPSSYARGVVLAEVGELIPPAIAEALYRGLPALDHRWRGRFLAHATLVGPESRGSSPVRLPRNDDTRESPGISGLYPIGEGAGYAGGIISAAVDGLRSAKAIIRRYAPLERK